MHLSLWIRESLFEELLKSLGSLLVLCPTGQKTMISCMPVLPEMNLLMQNTLPVSKEIFSFMTNVHLQLVCCCSCKKSVSFWTNATRLCLQSCWKSIPTRLSSFKWIVRVFLQASQYCFSYFIKGKCSNEYGNGWKLEAKSPAYSKWLWIGKYLEFGWN